MSDNDETIDTNPVSVVENTLNSHTACQKSKAVPRVISPVTQRRGRSMREEGREKMNEKMSRER